MSEIYPKKFSKNNKTMLEEIKLKIRTAYKNQKSGKNFS